MNAKTKKTVSLFLIAAVCVMLMATPAFAAGTGDVAGAIEDTWNAASGQIKTVVNNVVFPCIDLIIAVFFFAKLGIPRGYIDGFMQWIKQIIGLCLTTFLQATILIAGLMVIPDHCLLGLGLMLSAGEVPRIAGAFGLDTSTKANMLSAIYTAQAAVNTTKTVVQAVAR